MTINIQNRQHIRLFSPFNSVRAAFLKSCLCFLCLYGACVCCHPNLHFSVSVFVAFSWFLSRPLFNYIDALNGYRSPLPSPPPHPIPSPEPNLIKSQQKCFAKFCDEFKPTQTTMQTTYRKKYSLPLFHWKNEIGLLVEYHPQFGGSRV